MGVPYDVYKNDVFSFGVLCYVAMTNSMPFREDKNTNAAIVEQQKNRRYRWPHFVAVDCQMSVDRMLTFEQNDRPTAKEAKYLAFFKTPEQSPNTFTDDRTVDIYA